MNSVSSIPPLAIQQLCMQFGSTTVLNGIDLQIAAGERLAVIGPNGAGKSTLFHLVSGKLQPGSGDIRLRGESIVGRTPQEIYRRGLARSFQITQLFPRLSVAENLQCATLWALGYRYTFWRRLCGLTDVQQRVDALLERFGLTARRDVAAGALSYAEQRTLEIGIAMAGDADVILLDEPTAGMSRSESEAAVRLIREVTVGKTLMMVEHDMSVVFGLADRIAVLANGELIACDIPDKIRSDARVQEAYLGGLMESCT
ncbi:ABC transporter ATP-binding protein [uncultured Oxalicibacterium sp.]|uniref:ABC transporter ATP-binding protein n=1 Tax=uncultured Oxalicibacterium sp. TaxID=1168540 RepID=UPI0025F54D49|nr:ABC transporter ATP-binding protein [uncultured Oxalicibacterium sp.]